jgi:16S rRNA U1498 N3-methylase RsmE
VALARGAGFRPVRLGGLILRAETAALAAAAVVLLGMTPAGR